MWAERRQSGSQRQAAVPLVFFWETSTLTGGTRRDGAAPFDLLGELVVGRAPFAGPWSMGLELRISEKAGLTNGGFGSILNPQSTRMGNVFSPSFWRGPLSSSGGGIVTHGTAR